MVFISYYIHNHSGCFPKLKMFPKTLFMIFSSCLTNEVVYLKDEKVARLKLLQTEMKNCLDDTDFSDIDVECEGSILKCHKSVLSARSTKFKQLLSIESCSHKLVVDEIELKVLQVGFLLLRIFQIWNTRYAYKDTLLYIIMVVYRSNLAKLYMSFG